MADSRHITRRLVLRGLPVAGLAAKMIAEAPEALPPATTEELLARFDALPTRMQHWFEDQLRAADRGDFSVFEYLAARG